MAATALALITALAAHTAQVPAEAAAGYAAVLKVHVSGGKVDYAVLESTSLGKLDAYLAAVAKAPLPAARDARIAFWVDAYNALVLRAVIAAGKPKSVLDVKGFFDDVKHTVAGKKLSLNQLEKAELNPYAKDARTHMVLVCAAYGCPILESTPYVGSGLEARLDAATRRYLGSPSGAVVGPCKEGSSEACLKLSKIFEWYEADFGGKAGVLAFAKKHLPSDAAAKLGPAPTVSFLDYDWRLNKR
jgi:hypothetical protein